jgi:hypothetical protein
MDLYWAHVLEKDYHNHFKKYKPKKDSSKDRIIRDILCPLCGQNKYWCYCDKSLTNSKFDLNKQSFSKQENITNDASQKQEQEQISSGDHQKAQ